jgi:RHS repeat-associated protein
MDGQFHCAARLKQLFLLAVLTVSLVVSMTTATARCYNPGAIASRFEEQLREEQALTAKTVYTGVFDPGEKVQIGLFRWYDPNLQRFINRDPAGELWDINLYRFVGNDPLDLIDVNGLWPTGAFGSQNVHGNAIVRVNNYFTPSQLKILVNQQIIADQDQSARSSYKHAMRDGPGGEGREGARVQANRYLCERFATAKKLWKQGDQDAALAALGDAIHTMQDATSPEHYGFQPWDGNAFSPGAGKHGSLENFDPGSGSALDAATKAAIDYFLGGNAPKDFFGFGHDKLRIP